MMNLDRQRLLRWLRNLAICVVAAFALATLMEFLQIKTQPKAYVTTCETEDELLELDPSLFGLVQCRYEDGRIVVDNGPAQLDYSFAAPQPMDVVIVSMDKSQGVYIVRVLYAAPGETLDVEQSVQVVTDNGQSGAYVDLPDGDYDRLAIQIAGLVTVDSVEIATNATLSTAPAEEPMRFDRIMFVFCVLLVGLFALTQLGVWKRLIAFPGRAVKRLRAFGRRELISLLVFVGTGAAGWLFTRFLIRHDLALNINWMLNLCCVFAGICVGSLFCFHKTLGRKPEVFFFIFVLLIGSPMAFFCPDTNRIAWDDGYHYLNALRASYVDEQRQTEQDETSMIYGTYQEYDLAKWDAWHAEQDAADAKTAQRDRGPLTVGLFWSFTQGFGLYLGRVLGMSYWFTWSLGRFFGLLAYAIIGYFSIRRLKSGKMIMASILLIPEAIFLASQYSYDPAVIAFLCLGMSYFVAEWQESDKVMTWGNALVMILAVCAGCLVKAVYFPLLLMPLLLPKRKFKSVGHRRAFFAVDIAAILGLILYFVLPFFVGTSGGDVRGGDDVDAFGQIAFILKNPLQYTEILLNFIRYYLGTDNTVNLLGLFAYMDRLPNMYIYLVLLAVVTFTDREECDIALSDSKWIRLGYLVLLFGVVCLVVTGLYITFTPVGHYTVNGCQPRYMLPILFPSMIMLGTGRITNRANREIYNGILFAVIGFVGFSGVVIRCLSLFVG